MNIERKTHSNWVTKLVHGLLRRGSQLQGFFGAAQGPGTLNGQGPGWVQAQGIVSSCVGPALRTRSGGSPLSESTIQILMLAGTVVWLRSVIGFSFACLQSRY